MDFAHLVHSRGVRVLRFPALHFLIIGGLLFAAVAQQGRLGPFVERARLVIPRSRVALARRQFAEAYRRPLTPEEEKGIIEKLVDEEVLYRYALQLGMYKQPVAKRRLAKIAAFVAQNPHERKSAAERASEALDLGLHHGDLVVRRILIDGARRLIRAVVLVRQPSQEMLEAYLAVNGVSFITSAKTRITHVAVNRLKHGAGTEERGRVILEQLRQGSYSSEDAVALGDRAFVPALLPLLTDNDFARQFGYQFPQAVKTAPEGAWSGPIPSRYGLHFVYVHERKEPYVPPLSKIRKKVRRHLRRKLADEWLALRLQQLRAEYEIVVPNSS